MAQILPLPAMFADDGNICDLETQILEEDIDDSPFLNLPTNKRTTFEINFAELPIALYSKKTAKVITRHEYSDTIAGRNGAKVKRTWTIEARAKDEYGNDLGFGGPTTLEIIFMLFQIWRQQGLSRQRIYIGTYRNLLLQLGWGTGNSDYKRLKKTLDCIYGLYIVSHNSFYFKETGEYGHVKMHLFTGSVTLTKDEKEEHPDARFFISISPELHQIVQNNNLLYFDITLEEFRKLKPMEQKLALMLTKYFSVYKTPKATWASNIHVLANRIPIISKSAADIRKQLRRVCDGLLAKEFKYLSRYTIEKDKITFYNKTAQLELPLDEKPMPHGAIPKYVTIDSILDQMKEEISDDPKSFPFFIKAAKCVPEDMLREFISIAKAEGNDRAKMFVHLVSNEASEYMKESAKAVDAVEIDLFENKKMPAGNKKPLPPQEVIPEYIPSPEWRSCLNILKQSLNETTIETWFALADLVIVDGETVIIQTPNEFASAMIKKHFWETLIEALKTNNFPSANITFEAVNKFGLPSLTGAEPPRKAAPKTSAPPA